MIDPRELRIGNLGYCTYWEKVMTWGPEKSGHPHYSWCADDDVSEGLRLCGVNVEPILITPEWLERLGFVRTRDLIHTAEFVLLGGPCIHILFSKIDGRLYLGESFITRSGDDEDEFIAVPLTFIHQVQNLHFALTGQELTIKEVDNGI